MAAASERFDDYEIRSEPIESAGDYAGYWFGVYRNGQRVFVAEVRVSRQFALASGATADAEVQDLARTFGADWVRARLAGKSFIRGLQYLVRYTAGQPSPTVEIVGRLRG